MREIFWGLYGIWNMIQNMVWQISIVIGMVLVCRFFVGKVSKKASYLLWIVVAIRLLCPVMIPSDFSIFNWFDVSKMIESQDVVLENDAMEEVTSDVVQVQTTPQTVTKPEAQEEIEINTVVVENEVTQESNDKVIHNYFQDRLRYLVNENPDFFLWMTGMALMAVYGIGSYVYLKYKLRFATKSDESVFESNEVSSPFVFGIIKPKIYLPYHMSKLEKRYILAHESYHIKRRDYLVKIFAFALLTVYWLHPLVWVAFYLMSRDMEMSCDEQVLKAMGMDDRKAYSTLLLSFACNKRFPLPSPLSFGENDTKSRIKSILNYKKPTFWSLVAVLVLTVVLMVSCLTDANNSEENKTDNTTIDETYEITDEATKNLAKTLAGIKSPYIGDAVTNGKIFGVLLDELGINGRDGMELQTTTAPYWISLSFDEKPSEYKMWQASAMYLALVENASEVRWNYYDEFNDLCTRYVTVDSVNDYFGNMNLKDYAVSEEKIAELWELLDEKRVYEIYETNGEDASGLVFINNWEGCAIEAEMDFEERITWEKRLIADGIGYRGEEGIAKNCFYEDFDQNGTKDLIVILRDTNWDDNIDDKFCIYMNADPVYVHEVPYGGAFWNVNVADIDNDGFQEFLFFGDSGGTGGYGFNAIYELLKHKNGTFETMPLPLDEYCEYEEETAGFGIEVYTANGEGNYRAYIPALDESISFSIGSTLKDVFEADTPANTLVGRERYGFHELTPVLQNGRYYLLAKESLYRMNLDDRMEDIGTAYFLLSWDEAAGWIVEKFDVLPYGFGDISDEVHFDRMLRELAFYPMTYADIMATPNVPVVDTNNRLIKDSSNIASLQNFAEIESGQENGYVGNQMVYVKLTEDSTPVYHYIYHSSDGRYFYLEAYTMPSGNAGEPYLPMKSHIFADCIYESFDDEDGTSKTYYYLVEDGITSEDIFEYLISSYYTEPKFVSFLSVGTTSAFESISQVISNSWNIMPNEVVIDSWWNHSIQNTGNTAFYAYYEEETKQLVYKDSEEAYYYDLTEVLSGFDEWNWQIAGLFLNEKNAMTYICLSDFNITYTETQNPQTILIEFPTNNPEDYQITTFDTGLAWIDNCYLVGDCIYIQSQESLMAIDINAKELRYCTEERILLEEYAKKIFGEEPYHTYFFHAVRAENDTVIYSAAVAEANDTLPTAGMVFVACKNGEPIGYMCADYANVEASDGIVIEMVK